MIKRMLNWFRNNYDKDLEYYYNDENILTVGMKEGRHL